MNGELHFSPNGCFGAVSHAGCRGHRQPTMCSSGSPPSIQGFAGMKDNSSAAFLLLRREIVDDVYKFYLDVSELCYHSLSVSVKNEEWGGSVVVKGFRRVLVPLDNSQGGIISGPSTPFVTYPIVVPCEDGKKLDAQCTLISSDGVLEIVVAQMSTDGVVPDVERDVPIKRK